MAQSHRVTVDDRTFAARPGELLLNAALRNGVDMQFDCRAGHCGTCKVRLLSGRVHGGHAEEEGVVHACQSRIAGNAVIQSQSPDIWNVEGIVSSIRPLSSEVVQVGIQTRRALPYLAGQYAKVQFKGFPPRSFSLTHPLYQDKNSGSVCFHVRRMPGGQVSPALGSIIRPGRAVKVTGPYGSAHFRPNHENRVVLVSTSTGFAPIWAIACAALYENPERQMLVVAGASNLAGLYMGPALRQLSRFPNVRIVPVCSDKQMVSKSVRQGRPTDVLRRLSPTDIVYVCGAPPMVEAIQKLAAQFGAPCHADPFTPPPAGRDERPSGLLERVLGMLPVPTAAGRQRVAIAARQKQQLRLSYGQQGMRSYG
ncbi:MAG: 2Fe-2S iron-sulfur cluster-binding protein [Rhodomicrobiaceae bacterium]